MTRRLPPALARTRLFSHLAAGIAAAPLLIASLAVDDLAEFAGNAGRNVLPQRSEIVGQAADGPSDPLAMGSIETAPAEDLPAAETVRTAAADVPDLPAPTRSLGAALALPKPDFVTELHPDLVSSAIPIAIPTPRATVPATDEADLAVMRKAIAEYRKGNLAGGDALARQAVSETARLALEWAAIRLVKQAVGFARTADFARGNASLPIADWTENRAADALFAQRLAAEKVIAHFSARRPDGAAGKIALARALRDSGEGRKAEALVRESYRDDRTNAAMREAILREFPGAIGVADHRYLAERLIYEGQPVAGLAIAAKAGPQVQQLAQLLAAAIGESGSLPALIAKLDPALRNEPAALYARAQHLRRTGKFVEAAEALLAAPDAPERIVDGDEWWVERRMLARKLLDSGNAPLAYRIAAAHHAETSGQVVDAEVHAGWIALRFLNNAAVAAAHFHKARVAAQTPASLARAEYWQGRAAEVLDDPFASGFHAAAAAHRHTFYGQLSLARLGQGALPDVLSDFDDESLRQAAQSMSLRMIRALIDADALDLARPIVFEHAKKSASVIEVAALGDLLAQYRQPKLTLQTGKIAALRGVFSEEHAFPTFGIPEYEPLGQSAESAIVYSIARQESEFDAAVVSHAGARGLMQLMPATAMRTANRQKLTLDVNRLTLDASLNARIGAAHLGELFAEYNGSYILSFAAYNAGGKRVREWTTAYGDPRDSGIDKVDWIERIPITETRHYVQKILENLQIYRARLYGQRKLELMADLERGARTTRVQAASAAESSQPPQP